MKRLLRGLACFGLGLIGFGLLQGIADATTLSRLTTWTNGQVLTHSALNSEFDNFVNDYNGSISAANLAADSVASSELLEGDDYTMNNLILSTTAPDVRWNPTSGDSFHLGAEYSATSGSILFLSNVTDGRHYLVVRNDHRFEFPQYSGCDRLYTVGNGLLVCGSDNVTTSARVHRTEGDISTTSTSLVSATGMTISLSTGANPVLVGFNSFCTSNTAGDEIGLNITVDGADAIGTDYSYILHTTERRNCNFTLLTSVLTAGPHTVQLQFKRNAGTGTITLNCDSTAPCQLWAVEVPG